MRKQPLDLPSVLYRKITLGAFALLMIFGNFSRLLPLDHFPSHVSVLEIVVYLLTFPAYFSRLRKSHLLILGILVSCGYGALLNGFDSASSLYALKLIGMIGSAVVIGEYLRSEGEAATFLLWVFGCVLGVGIVIFLFFPKAETLFALLKDVAGIQFYGDPHQRRFLSPFFDPNYYSAIASLPLILAFWKKRWGLFSLFLASIALTFSRSGIATCAMVLGMLLTRVRGGLSWKGIPFSLLVSIPLAFPREIGYLFQRTVHLVEDPSAMARFETFRVAFAFFWEHPFFGVGYHYLSKGFEEAFGRLSPDSSVLITLTNFGLIPSLAMLFGVAWWSINHFQRGGVFSLVYFYAAICILFSSLFNNLLYYPYWFIPVGALLTRMGGDQHASGSRSRLAHPDGWGRKGLRSTD